MKNNFLKSEIEKILKKLKVKKDDDVMIHGDAGVIFQYGANLQKNFNVLFKTINNCIGKNGTILIPAFTPSFCKKKIFYKDSRENELGSFGEIFTQKKNLSEHLTQFLVF